MGSQYDSAGLVMLWMLGADFLIGGLCSSLHEIWLVSSTKKDQAEHGPWAKNDPFFNIFFIIFKKKTLFILQI